MKLVRPPKLILLILCTLALGVLGAVGIAGTFPDAKAANQPPPLLPPVAARGMQMDTLLLGGYARGSFADALQTIASGLSGSERTMIGRHLDKMFATELKGEDMERGGRLRLAYERSARPDGSTRSIRVLAAEAAVGGAMHRVFFHEQGTKPGYFDDLGRSLDAGGWVRPLPEARVTSPFGTRRMHPILRRVLPHLGVDYRASSGTPVHATGDGSVSIAGRRGGYGNLVELQHPNGLSTRYAHLSRIAPELRQGGMVRQGEVVGYVGMTGLATGPHLHYEIRRHGQPIDPQATSLTASLSADVGVDAEWRREHQRLAQLLARAPRATQRRSTH